MRSGIDPPDLPHVTVNDVKLRLTVGVLVNASVTPVVPEPVTAPLVMQARKLALAVLAELIVNVRDFVALVVLPVQLTSPAPLGTPVSVTLPPEIKLFVHDLQSAVEGICVIDPEPLVTDFVNT